MTLTLEKLNQQFMNRQQRQALGYTPCPSEEELKRTAGGDFRGQFSAPPLPEE